MKGMDTFFSQWVFLLRVFRFFALEICFRFENREIQLKNNKKWVMKLRTIVTEALKKHFTLLLYYID
ncbi:hypothetical protein HCUR_00932 [Holospora curviuscula]|uniref:Uncharacterized protein n=1 Tax=Holospora curviuscula TaxID=1082868 RepID=A0A2S5R8Z7_9PROT|nr:hypothetical protein HCUR_00932 [Holospora curviuscula]